MKLNNITSTVLVLSLITINSFGNALQKISEKEFLKEKLYQSFLEKKGIKRHSNQADVDHVKRIVYAQYLAEQNKNDPRHIEIQVREVMAEELFNEYLQKNNLKKPQKESDLHRLKEKVVQDYWEKRHAHRQKMNGRIKEEKK